MKVVLDSNVLVSGYGWPGRCREVVRECLALEVLVYGREILEEAERGWREKTRASEADIEEAMAELRGGAKLYDPIAVDGRSCRDPKDIHVLGVALAAQANYIVTGDRDLLVLKEFRGIRILTPAEFLELLQGRRDTE